MADTTTELRHWLTSLNNADLTTLVSVNGYLRSAAQVPQSTREITLNRRQSRALRTFLAKASASKLSSMASSMLAGAAETLETVLGFSPEEVAHPTLEQLSRMLIALGEPVGKLALFGLLLGDAPATPLACEHRDELEKLLSTSTSDDQPPTERRSEQSPASEDTVLDELQDHWLEFQDLAGTTADLMRDAADRSSRGLPLAEEHESALHTYVSQRTALAAHFAENSIDIARDAAAGSWLEQLEKVRAEQKKSRVEQAAAAAKAADLQAQIDNLQQLLTTTTGSIAEHLRNAIGAAQKDLADLTGAPSDDTPSDSVREEPFIQDDRDATTAQADPEESAGHESLPEQAAPPTVRADDQSCDEAPEESEPNPDENAEFEHGFPWDEGEPPLAVELVSKGRLAEAYWVTVSSAETETRGLALRFTSAAYQTRSQAEATAVLAALDIDLPRIQRDKDTAILVVSGMIRAGLIAGWGHQALEHINVENGLPEAWFGLLEAGISAVRHRCRLDTTVGVLAQGSDLDIARKQLGDRAQTLADELPRRKNPYHRATRVLQYLTGAGRPLAAALDTVHRWSLGEADVQNLHDAIEVLSGPDTLIETADAAVRTPKQAREQIVAAALRVLQRAIDEVRTVVAEAIVVSNRITAEDPDTNSVNDLRRAVTAAETAGPVPGMAGAAVVLLIRWLKNPGVETGPRDDVSVAGLDGRIPEPALDVLLPLYDLPRTSDGRPDSDDPATPAVLARLNEPVELVPAVKAYADRGDLPSIRRILELCDQGSWQAAADPGVFLEIAERARERWQLVYRRQLGLAVDLFARVRTQNLLDSSEEAAAGGLLQSLQVPEDEAYDVASAELAVLVDELKGKQQTEVDSLRRQLVEQHPSASDHERVKLLLDDGDTVTASEFLSFIRDGKPLPITTVPATQDIHRFAELIARASEAKEGLPRRAAEWAALAGGGSPAEIGRAGIDAWDSLPAASSLRHKSQLSAAIRAVLTTLGIRASTQPKELPLPDRRSFRKFRVPGEASDGSYVSVLGSSATDYTVTVVFEEVRGRNILAELGPEDVGRANVVLYLHPLGLAGRRTLAANAAGSAAQALVIDAAVLGWVAKIAPGSWRATQRVTLPWTALNPYTPFVAGLVPPEVFVGRRKEMREVVDPHGGLFLYGGRQLGKSALLRRVEANFGDDFQEAVYLDLTARGIGEAEPAGRIWRELTVELKKRGVLAQKVSDDAPADVVAKQVQGWLEGQGNRRLLLLADEADAFLTADSHGVRTPGGTAIFRNVRLLKDLMESTGRRFKVVFAGLHQVQRFGDLANVPLVHGGPDILVGPLEPEDARQLVIEPLAALGYVFDRPELVWRLLSTTNYQASLIQIVCNELVNALHRRVSVPDSIPITVREEDVEAVVTSDHIRSSIADRLRITVNLDHRYRVLMLIIAVRSIEDGFRVGYGADELLMWANEHWSAGFEDFKVPDLRIYLKEMEGLGLLVRLPQDKYAVRSPNVVTMLGPKAELERELRETAFEVPYEYNAREARRLLDTTRDGREVRSPLTEGELAEFTKLGALTVLTGSKALGAERIGPAVENYAGLRGTKVESVDSVAGTVKAVSTAARRSKAPILIVDFTARSIADIEQALPTIHRATCTVILLVSPDHAERASELAGTQWRRPSRWTSSSLRSWPECPFDSPETRRALIEATGGWPDLVARTIAMVTKGSTKDAAIKRILEDLAQREFAETQIRREGLPFAFVERLGLWAEIADEGEMASPDVLADVLGTGLAETARLLAQLNDIGVLDETDDGVALDRVTHRIIRLLRGKP
ncbi:hypothetical protein [Amycolatopsis sp. NPDC098790]|uniref:hypothetical protein n=1 Tax=Amycolatopsis sp. NPDC098790 TaxID=3363939 RepID=UPI00382ECF41